MIDPSTIASLELIQNIENPKSRQCLFGFLNQTLTPMGARYLRTNILQPSTDLTKITLRLNAVAELSTLQDVLFILRQGQCQSVQRFNFANTHSSLEGFR
jgi:DNA mismatch repair protein MSH4